MSKIHQSIAFNTAVCFLFLGMFVHGADPYDAKQKLTSTDEVLSVPRELAAEIEPNAHFYRPLTYARYNEHRTLFLSKLQHIRAYMQNTIRKARVQEWESKYQPTLLTGLVCGSYPDVHRLREIYTDSYETFVEDQRFDVVASESILLLRTTALAFRRYLVTLEDQRDPHSATVRLRRDLSELKTRLKAYSEGDGIGNVTDFCELSPAVDQITAIDKIVERIRLSEQATPLVDKIWGHYMQPKARLHLSTNLLTKIISVDLPTTPITRHQPNAIVRGTATPHNRLIVYSKPNRDRAELGVAYRGTFTFCGTLFVTSPIKRTTGLQMGLCQNTSKTLLLEEDAADSSPARSATSLIYAKTQRGRLFDKLVTPSLRRNVPKDPVNDQIRNIIDTAVTELGNIISTQASGSLSLITADYPRERHYSSTADAIEVTVYSARSGFLQDRLTLPRADGADYDLTLHSSIRPTLCNGEKSRIVDIIRNTLLSKDTVKSLMRRVEKEGFRFDYSNGYPLQSTGNDLTLNLVTKTDATLKLTAYQKPDGSLGILLNSDDSEGKQTANQLIRDVQFEVLKAQFSLPTISQFIRGREQPESTLVRGENSRVLYDDGYISLRGNLSQ